MGREVLEYVSKNITNDKKKQFKEIFLKLKEKLGKDWTIIYYLVGSSKRNLVYRVKNGNKGFDLDYRIELVKYPKELTAKEIKLKFKQLLDGILNDYGLTHCEDSTHVLTTKHVIDDKIEYSYDIAIMKKNKNNQYILLKNNKQLKDSDLNKYNFVETPKHDDFSDKMKLIKKYKKWGTLREKYKGKKEKYIHLSKDNRPSSFELFLEAVNEVVQLL